MKKTTLFISAMMMVLLSLTFFATLSYAERIILATQTVMERLPITSWKTQRDSQIVKQHLDFSCGAASMATLLNGFYGQHLTEQALLIAMNKQDWKASFDDMAKVMPQFGFKAQGFAASWEQLVQLTVPVIVYLKHRNNEHFSVIRGINENTIWLADPSLGNRTYSKEQFLAMWETRQNDQENSHLSGKFLAILPLGAQIQNNQFFTRYPVRQTAQSVKQLVIQARLAL